jgi:uncharacterized membrane protein YphA (DoxX/SURF4 family)
MKKINIIYWVFTGILVAVMLFSGITGIMNTPESIKMLSGHFGYPAYFNQYLGVAKVLGSIALLVPGFPRLKEWAYAGFTFDMISAVYSEISVHDSVAQWAPIFIFIAFLAVSYIYHHKRLKAADIRDVAS